MEKVKAKELYQKAIKVWGEKAQLEMLQEEATELALATRKYIRKPNEDTLSVLASEVADVKIMLEQLAVMLPDIVTLANQWGDLKLERLDTRLLEKRFED